MAITEGYLVGLGMVIFLGPVFFTLLQSTLQQGVKAGLAIAFGIFCSDLLVLAICSFGAKNIFKNKENQFWIALLGSIILFFLGIKYIVKPNLNTETRFKPTVINLFSFFAKGFVVNFVNPFVFLVWISTMAYTEAKFEQEKDRVIFFAGALLGILTTDSLKVFLAAKLQQVLNPIVLKKIYQLIGMMLIGFGFRLLYFILG
jgi:threonine/homoserine/homoserine lactone efflux protein